MLSMLPSVGVEGTCNPMRQSCEDPYEGGQDSYEEGRDSFEGAEGDDEFLDVEDHEDGLARVDLRKVS